MTLEQYLEIQRKALQAANEYFKTHFVQSEDLTDATNLYSAGFCAGYAKGVEDGKNGTNK